MSDDQPPLPGTGPPRRPPKAPRGSSGDASSRLTQALLRIGELETNLRQLQDEVTRAVTLAEEVKGVHDQAPPPYYCPQLGEPQQAEFERAVRIWVYDVLRHDWRAVRMVLKPCWWEHPDAREHVCAVWFAWLGAYRAPRRSLQGPDTWVRQSIPALRDALPGYLGAGRDECDIHRGWTWQEPDRTGPLPPDPEEPPPDEEDDAA